MALINLSGYVFKDDGTAVSGATVQLYQTDSATLVTLSDGSTSTTTDSNGYWSASVTEAGATSGYDVKITSGSSLRKRRGNDRLQIEELDIRNDQGNTQGGLLVANTTNNASNKVATFAGRNTTNADNDEIYLTFEIHNDADEITEYARMTAVAIDVSNGSEDGEIQFDVMKSGTLTKVWSISSSTAGATSFDIETSTVTMAVDDFTIKSEDDGSAAILYMFADQGDDDADKWRIQVADGGVMTYASLISSSYVTHMTITPHATVASSTVAFAGGVTIAGDLTITGDDLTMGTNTNTAILVADGTNYNPVVPSGDVALTNAGVFAIASGVILNADVNASAAIAVSKTALTAGTGISLSTNTLNVDAAQTQITSVGTIGTGVWNGTAIASTYIAADAITGAKIADDAIGSEHIADDAVVSAAIADDAITSALIADDAITTALIADDAITSALIADDAITSALIADDAITTALIADDAITSALIADDAIITALIADDAVDSDEIAAGAVDTAHIGNQQVTAVKMFNLARGSVLVGNTSAATAELTIGSNNYILTSDGTDIAWEAAAAGGVSAGQALAFSIIF